MSRTKKPARSCANCGDGWAHHAVADEPCWGPECLTRPEAERCTSWADGRPPVERTVAPVGHAHPATAKAAAARALPRSGSLRRQVLEFIRRKGGCTDDDLEYLTGRSHQSVSAVRNSLMNDGWIGDSGQRRATRYGNDAIVWTVLPD